MLEKQPIEATQAKLFDNFGLKKYIFFDLH